MVINYLLTETSHCLWPNIGRFKVSSALNNSPQATAMEGRVTIKLRGMITSMPLTRRVPPERTSEMLLTVALHTQLGQLWKSLLNRLG